MKKLITLLAFLGLFACAQAQEKNNSETRSNVEKVITTIIKNSGAEAHNKFLVIDNQKIAWALYTIKDESADVKFISFKLVPGKTTVELEKELIVELMQELQEKGIKQIAHTVKPELQKLYLELGFEVDITDESGRKYIKYL